MSALGQWRIFALKRTYQVSLAANCRFMFAFEGKADIAAASQNVRL
jgi:hypothetical protein